MDRTQRGLSVRHLILFFLAGVAVCGVFFALGFLVGYNQRPAGAGGVETERLVSAGAVPPTVNPSPGADKSAGEDATSASSAGGAATGENGTSSPMGARGDNQASQTNPADRANPAAQATQPRSAKPKRGGPAPEVTETDLEKEEIGQTAGTSTPPGAPDRKAAAEIVIQVVASRTRQDATNLVNTLKTHGYSAFLVTPEEAKAGDKLYRVEVGPFASRHEAERIRERLSGLGYKPFIRR